MIFDLSAACQETKHVLLLRGVVTHVDLGTELHFLDLDLGLLLASLLGLDRLVVLELSVVHDAAHGGFSVRRDFDKVQTGLFCDAHGLAGVEDTHLRTVIANQTALASADFFIEPGLLSCYCAHLLHLPRVAGLHCNKKPCAHAQGSRSS